MYKDLKALGSHKAYRNMLIARTISRFGDSIDVVAFSWLVYEITGSAALLGVVYILNILPNLILSPFIGPLVNYLPTKPLLVIGDALRGVFVIIIAALYMTGLLEPWHLYLLTLLTSTVEVFAMAAKGAIFQLTLPDELYMKANSIGNSIVQTAQLIGFALAGGVVAILGVEVAFLIDAATFLISALMILVTLLPNRPIRKFENGDYLESLKSGYRFILNDKTLVSILGLCLVFNFLITPINALLPVYVKETLSATASAIGILSVAITVGSLLGGLVVNHFGERYTPYQCLIVPLVGVGVLYAGLSLPLVVHFLPAVLIASLSFFVIGLMLPFVNVLLSTYMMKRTPNEIIAHVGGLVGMVVMVSNPIGAGFFGLISDKMNIGTLFVYNGIAMVAFTLLFATFKTIRKLNAYASINDIPGIKQNEAA
ncbi:MULTISPECIES: MFS transporter [unclassified Fusibacter]|uniref:MFS transporter n=1 Tax=unclassified Fusibacter TaxID=2624464 RepID=UPI0013E966F0|nr:MULTISPECIES: MFS transporter [unclassified Fusibacter]MCK8060161.1 MFS transporter [Fusibacter sp. A2]NPE22301.1 MFS transporter [Fusibacter sp. A1]